MKNSFEFTIHHGSGYFSVTTNTSDVADVIHRDRTVKIVAKDTGALLIRVEDIEIPDAEIATAEIIISDIKYLHISAPCLLIE